MILILLIPMILWSVWRDFLWSSTKKHVIPWSQHEKNSWSCNLEMSITHDPAISRRRKFVILWSRNLENSWSRDLKMQQPHDLVISELKKNDRMIWGLIILWSHYLWDCNICDPRNFSSCWTIFAAVEKKYSTLGNLNSRPIRNTKVRAEAVGLYFSWWNILQYLANSKPFSFFSSDWKKNRAVFPFFIQDQFFS